MVENLLLFSILITLWFIVSVTKSKVIEGKDISFLTESMIGNIVSILLSLLFIYLIGLSFTEAGFQRGEITFPFIIAAVIGILFRIFFSLSFFKKMPIENVKEEFSWFKKLKGDKPYFRASIFGFFLQGPMEVIFFWGFVQASLQSYFISGAVATIEYATLVTATIYALMHLKNILDDLENFKVNLRALPFRFLSGLWIGMFFKLQTPSFFL